MRHDAEEQLGETALPPASDHDDVGIHLFRHHSQRHGDSSIEQRGAEPDPGRLDRRALHLLELNLAPRQLAAPCVGQIRVVQSPLR
jgi:hypothetical protein